MALLNMKITTTDATPTELEVASGTFLEFANEMTAIVVVRVVARRTDVLGDSAGYELICLAQRNGGPETMEIVGSVTKVVIAEGTGATSWDCNVSADTTNGALKIEATGEAAKTIEWTACIHMNDSRDFAS